MESRKKELRKALKLVIKGLIIQEVRRIQLQQSFSPPFILDEMVRSIEEAKRQVIALVRWLPSREREVLVKRLMRQSVDEEIDQAIRVRQKRCFRCVHVRYFDEEGTAHSSFPMAGERARVIGCEVSSSSSASECRSFVESSLAASLKDYLDEMSILYEVKEMFDRFERIWEEYLTK
ncbi:MAG: hypothetical protein ACUVWO_02070 [Thermodesulfobacteriota bacterium]